MIHFDKEKLKDKFGEFCHLLDKADTLKEGCEDVAILLLWIGSRMSPNIPKPSFFKINKALLNLGLNRVKR